MKWTVRNERFPTHERDESGWKYKEIPDQRTHTLEPTLFGGPNARAPMSGIELKEHFNYPGGPGFGFGPKVKGEEQRWPVLTLQVALPYERLDLRAALAEKLKATVEQFVLEHGLRDGRGGEE